MLRDQAAYEWAHKSKGAAAHSDLSGNLVIIEYITAEQNKPMVRQQISHGRIIHVLHVFFVFAFRLLRELLSEE